MTRPSATEIDGRRRYELIWGRHPLPLTRIRQAAAVQQARAMPGGPKAAQAAEARQRVPDIPGEPRAAQLVAAAAAQLPDRVWVLQAEKAAAAMVLRGQQPELVLDKACRLAAAEGLDMAAAEMGLRGQQPELVPDKACRLAVAEGLDKAAAVMVLRGQQPEPVPDKACRLAAAEELDKALVLQQGQDMAD